MIWRVWSFLAGAAVGPLALLAVGGSHDARALPAYAAATGCLLLAAGSIARARADDPTRGAHLACAASAGLVALPAAAGAALALPPGPRFWLVAQVLLLGAALAWAARVRAPSGGALRQLRSGLFWLLGGVAGVLGVGVASAAMGGAGPVLVEGRAEAILDADARVATRELPVCRDAAAEVRVLHDRGGRPRLEPGGEGLWFDATAAGGRRQLFRLALPTGEIDCFTCEEPGNNARPDPGPAGLVFETDRHADWRDPSNTELHLLRARRGRSPEPSRRLTRSPGPDDHGLIEPTAGRIVWSRRRAGGYEVVWAPLRSAHGALLLGGASTLARGGSVWLAPAAWSPDARSLVLLRGNPFAATAARAVDFATGATRDLAQHVARGGVAFSADGGLVAIAGTRRDHGAGRLPAALGAAFAPIANRLAVGGGLHRQTYLSIGPVAGPLRRLPVPEVERWGAPTGLSLSEDGVTLYLAQRASDGRERLVRIRRDCRERAVGRSAARRPGLT